MAAWRGTFLVFARRLAESMLFLGGLSVVVAPLVTTTRAEAQVAKTNQDLRAVGDDPRGLPAEVFLQKPLGLLAREMLLQSHLDENANVPRPQRKGVQIELFTPGDFGVLVRYRW